MTSVHVSRFPRFRVLISAKRSEKACLCLCTVMQHKALKLILGTIRKSSHLAAEIRCGIPPMLIKLFMRINSLQQRYQNNQLAEIRTDRNLVDQFYRIAGTTGTFTKSMCLSYVKKRWNNIFRSPLTSTLLDPFINEIELHGITIPKHANTRLELTLNKLLLTCNVELAKYACNIWRAESSLCQCRNDTESVAHYLSVPLTPPNRG